jgi:hypothetical protein
MASWSVDDVAIASMERKKAIRQIGIIGAGVVAGHLVMGIIVGIAYFIWTH